MEEKVSLAAACGAHLHTQKHAAHARGVARLALTGAQSHSSSNLMAPKLFLLVPNPFCRLG